MKKIAIVLTAIALAILIGSLCISYALMHLFSDTYHLKISWSKIDRISGEGLVVRSLAVADTKAGFGFFAKRATIKLRWNDLFKKGALIDFELDNVHFRKRAVETEKILAGLDGLIATPFTDKWNYKELSGTVQPTKTSLLIKRFAVRSDEIRVSATGTVNYDHTLNLAITLDFADKTIAKLPDQLTKVVLEPKGEGWKSITVNLTGDYKAPSIQISSKLFRLTINSLNSKP